MRGNQIFDQFPTGFALAPGGSVTVTSGPTAKTGTGFLLWTNDNIWNNSGDPGRLIDPDGKTVAETGQ
jgi:competence protein ComEC